MMKLEVIADILGKILNKKFILLRQDTPNPTFKVYSNYKIELYEKIGKDTNCILSHLNTYNKTKTNAIEEIEKEFLTKLFGYITKKGENPILCE